MGECEEQLKTKANDPAFLTEPKQFYMRHEPDLDTSCGLSKREYFAAMAMQGMIAGSQGLQITVEQFATQSLKLADALIAELNK